MNKGSIYTKNSKKSLLAVSLLLLITCGIYMIYWVYTT
ncbi:DUF4234 domain-containing protein [Brachyspira murdochii]|nr:DUF4234 domain-containing protein [Brachyspira murdochii]